MDSSTPGSSRPGTPATSTSKATTAWDHFAVKVEDVDETVAQIDHHGVVEEPGDQPAAGPRTAFVNDPDGHVVELIEPLE